MANKRQKKKQKAKQNSNLLVSLGVPKKEAKKRKNKVTTTEIKLLEKKRQKDLKKEKRQQLANDRSRLIQALGLKVSDHASKRYWKESRFNDWYEKEKKKAKRREQQREYRERKKRESSGQMVLQLYWKDRTDTTIDDSTLQYVKESGKSLTIVELVSHLNEARNYSSGEIGDYKIEVTDKPSQVESYLNEYYKEYQGNGTQYKKLLIAIGAMFAGLYYPHEKELFLYELTLKMFEVNQKAAKRLQEDFQLYF